MASVLEVFKFNVAIQGLGDILRQVHENSRRRTFSSVNTASSVWQMLLLSLKKTARWLL